VTDGCIAGPACSSQQVDQEASEMNMICKWVHDDDGALVMRWAVRERVQAGGSDIQWETGGGDVAYAFEVFDDHADALTPVGV